MYMITILQLQAYRATGNKVYLDHAALEMVAYLDKRAAAQRAVLPRPGVPVRLGPRQRLGSGGMSELLSDLPKDHPKRVPALWRGYTRMMASLLKYQDSEGIWHQLLDHPESYQESSCTAMFTYAMITGVKKGFLRRRKATPKRRAKGWLGVNKFIDRDGNVDKVCVGTGQTNSLDFYTQPSHRKGQSAWPGSSLVVRRRSAQEITCRRISLKRTLAWHRMRAMAAIFGAITIEAAAQTCAAIAASQIEL